MDLSLDANNDLLMRALYIAGALITLFILVRVAVRLAQRAFQDPTRAYHVSRTIRRTGAVVGLIVLVVMFSPDARAFVTVLTVIGAGLAIAMREALLAMAGWIRIVTLSEFKTGDRIQVGDVHGDVIDVRLMRTTLMETRSWVDADQSTGRIVHVPNSWVWLHAVHNYSRGFSFIWNELPLTVTFRSDWRAARTIMNDLAAESAAIVEQQAAEEIRQMSRDYLIHYGILTPFVYVRVVENGVRLTLRYLCEVRKRRGTEHAITALILDRFREHGAIEFAYPAVSLSTSDTTQFGGLPSAPPAPPHPPAN